MLQNLRTLAFGSALSAASKDQLNKWLLGNRTGDTRLRAGLPPGWRCGDKTGSGERGATNDIGVVWPPQGSPVLVTVYLTETTARERGAQRNACRRGAAPRQCICCLRPAKTSEFGTSETSRDARVRSEIGAVTDIGLHPIKGLIGSKPKSGVDAGQGVSPLVKPDEGGAALAVILLVVLLRITSTHAAGQGVLALTHFQSGRRRPLIKFA